MQPLTPQGQQAVQNIAFRYNLNIDSVTNMLQAVVNGGGTMAQFSIPELGGSGQWMQGGMTMVGDMFNHGLQATVNNLCSELSNLINSQTIFEAPAPSRAGTYGNWYPSEFGTPTSSGAQNDTRYAYFAGARRLVIEYNGNVSIFDTLDHNISGISQQQGGNNSLQFTSQYGLVDTINLPLISGTPPQSVSEQSSYTTVTQPTEQPVSPAPENTDDIYKSIEMLADLHNKGILTDEEFSNKKAELLSRL